jgi:microcystin-dependent protein
VAEPFVGEIRIFANNYAPSGWAYCNGQLLDITQNGVLFAIIGATYGGDGSVTFGLPDLRGRAPLHVGGQTDRGTGLNAHTLGEHAGASSVALDSTNLPSHTHTLKANQEVGNNTSPNGGYIAYDAVGADQEYAPNTNPLNATLNLAQLASAGGTQAHNNMQPCLALSFCIALTGEFPSPS